MTQDVTDCEPVICTDDIEWHVTGEEVSLIVDDAFRLYKDMDETMIGTWILKLLAAGFCFTLMAGCSLTYKGPQYDLSTLAGLRPEPVPHRTTAGMLSQQRDYQRDLLP